MNTYTLIAPMAPFSETDSSIYTPLSTVSLLNSCLPNIEMKKWLANVVNSIEILF